MYYILKTLENLKTIPILSPLASVRDHSPPTSGGKWSRNGGTGWGYRVSKYKNYYIYLLKKKKQNKNTEAKITANNHCAEFSSGLNLVALTKHNEFYPLYFRPDQLSAISLREIFNSMSSVIEFNHNNNKLTLGGVL